MLSFRIVSIACSFGCHIEPSSFDPLSLVAAFGFGPTRRRVSIFTAIGRGDGGGGRRCRPVRSAFSTEPSPPLREQVPRKSVNLDIYHLQPPFNVVSNPLSREIA